MCIDLLKINFNSIFVVGRIKSFSSNKILQSPEPELFRQQKIREIHHRILTNVAPSKAGLDLIHKLTFISLKNISLKKNRKKFNFGTLYVFPQQHVTETYLAISSYFAPLYFVAPAL